QVGRPDPELLVATVREAQHPRVLEEPADDGADPDPLGQPGHTGAQRADPAYHQVHLDPGLAGPVERVDQLFVHNRVDLDLNARWQTDPRVLDLAFDALDDAGPHAVRGHEQPPVRGLPAVPGQHVEQVGQVGRHLRVGGQQAEVLVDAGRLGVVVARTDVAVPAQLTA